MNFDNKNFNNNNIHKNNSEKQKKIPSLIFIVPYRNRESHLNCFLNHMPYILEDINEDYEIIISHQMDNRPFNRGAMKNLGFYYCKNKYPENYKDITFVFNDVDTMPGKKNMIHYKTKKGIIKHFYGYKFALGGVFSITGYDFEKINGFPNYWGWGFEDNRLKEKALQANIKIDHSEFFNVNHIDFLQFYNGMEREMNKESVNVYKKDRVRKITKNENELSDITNIKYKIENIERNKIVTSKQSNNQNLERNKNNIYFVNFINWNIPVTHKKIEFLNNKELMKIEKEKRNTIIKNNNKFKLLFK